MGFIVIFFKPIVSFALVASFSLFFMQLFVIAGVLSAKIQRNVADETSEEKNLRGYLVAAWGGLVAGSISLTAMVFL